jgi:N-acetylglutamate synthase-like GNAT family acetyltransferase
MPDTASNPTASPRAEPALHPPAGDVGRTMEIRPFESRDAAAVLDLVLSIQQREFGLPVSADSQPDLLDIRGRYQCGNGNFWTALSEGQVVGTIGLRDIGQGRTALRKMFVAAPMRGSRHGVAQRLLGTLLGWCRDRGVDEVWLGTTEKFLAAHRFYEKNGFDRVAPQALPRSFPVMAVDTRFYRRSLGRAACPPSGGIHPSPQ